MWIILQLTFYCVTPENIDRYSDNISEATISWDDLGWTVSYEILYNFGAGYTSFYRFNSITLPLSALHQMFFMLEHIVRMISNQHGQQFNLSL